MKRLFALSFFFLFTFSLAIAQAQANDTAVREDTKEGPIMTFEATEVDYGTIKKGSDPLRTFKFTNTGTEPLVIKNARGSCGCTVPSYPKEPILPGEEGTIEVRYDTKRVGDFGKTVTLTTNAVVEKYVLRIKGKVLPDAPEEKQVDVPASKPNVFDQSKSKG